MVAILKSWVTGFLGSFQTHPPISVGNVNLVRTQNSFWDRSPGVGNLENQIVEGS